MEAGELNYWKKCHPFFLLPLIFLSFSLLPVGSMSQPLLPGCPCPYEKIKGGQ